MKVSENFKLVSLSVLLAVGLSACDNRDNDNRGVAGTTGTSGSPARTGESAGAKLDRATDQAGAAIDDAAITAKVKAALVAEPGLSAMQINVDTDKGVVTLSGSIDSLSNSEKAKTLAVSVAGVKGVENRLQLKS